MNDDLVDGWYMYFYTDCSNYLRWTNQLLVEENNLGDMFPNHWYQDAVILFF